MNVGYIDSGLIPKFASCESEGVAWFKICGLWQDVGYTQSPGDIIFFDWEQDGSSDHVGIVKKVENGIIGLAIGDAMGVPLEFCMREKLMQDPITTMLGYVSHNEPKGSWSDDTSMTLIDSISNTNKIDTSDIAQRFINWIKNSEISEIVNEPASLQVLNAK